MFRPFTRRKFLKLGLTATGGVALGLTAANRFQAWKQPGAGVTILKASSYEANLVDLIRRGLQDYPQVLTRVRGGVVVLKPNLVEYYEARRVNTHPAVVAAAIEAFRLAGAKEVVVAEGPGHRRDTEMLLEESGLDDVLKQARTPFVDLNLDTTRPVSLSVRYTGLARLFLPETVLNADLLVSMPKLKTHHWAGATLSLKNMFGVVPGVRYGWPKNVLHWRGIHNSIVDINAAVRPGFAIVDGIEGMEGDGPLFGETVRAGVLVMGDNLTAVDATGVRVMGMYPGRFQYLAMMLGQGGTISASRIDQRGERVEDVRREFRLVEHFNFLREPSPFLDFIRAV